MVIVVCKLNEPNCLLAPALLIVFIQTLDFNILYIKRKQSLTPFVRYGLCPLNRVKKILTKTLFPDFFASQFVWFKKAKTVIIGIRVHTFTLPAMLNSTTSPTYAMHEYADGPVVRIPAFCQLSNLVKDVDFTDNQADLGFFVVLATIVTDSYVTL